MAVARKASAALSVPSSLLIILFLCKTILDCKTVPNSQQLRSTANMSGKEASSGGDYTKTGSGTNSQACIFFDISFQIELTLCRETAGIPANTPTAWAITIQIKTALTITTTPMEASSTTMVKVGLATPLPRALNPGRSDTGRCAAGQSEAAMRPSRTAHVE